MRSFAAIAAADRELGIGRDGDLPWRLRSEMAHFTRTTRDTESPERRNAVFMGRVNWEAIPPKYRPLPGRLNAVLTRRDEYQVPAGVLVASGLEALLETLAAPPLADEIEKVFCIGGGRIYAQAIELPACEQLILTRIHATFDCDTFFPRFDHLFEQVGVIGEGEDDGIRWTVEDWRRRAS
jgi:dihydrofolate reductase/thymidylate synthase